MLDAWRSHVCLPSSCLCRSVSPGGVGVVSVAVHLAECRYEQKG